MSWFNAWRDKPEPVAKHVVMSAFLPGMQRKPIKSHNSKHLAEIVANNPLAWTCVQMISGAIGQVKFHVESENGEPDWNHPITKLCNKPNRLQGRQGFYSLTAQSLAVTGNAYWSRVAGSASAVLPGGGRIGIPQELRCERPQLVSVIFDPGTLDAKEYIVTQGTVSRTLSGDEVQHLRHWWVTEQFYGVSAVPVGLDSLMTYDAVNGFHRATAQNGGIPAGAIIAEGGADKAGNLITDEDMAELRENLEKFKRGGDLEGKLLLLNAKGGKFNIAAFPRVDASVSIERQAEALYEICNLFGIPPILLKTGQGATFENQGEARLAFWNETLIPRYVDVIADSLSQFLGVTIKADLTQIEALAEARKSQWEKVEKCTFLTTNEKRTAMGYDPLPAEQPETPGDMIIIPATMTTLEMVTAEPPEMDQSDGLDDGTDTAEAQAKSWLASEQKARLNGLCDHD